MLMEVEFFNLTENQVNKTLSPLMQQQDFLSDLKKVKSNYIAVG